VIEDEATCSICGVILPKDRRRIVDEAGAQEDEVEGLYVV